MLPNILIIDDEGIVRGALKAVLEQKGYHVRAAADGYDGVAKLKESMPNLVLLDRDMPGMTGSDVLRAIRKLDKGVKVIVLSGHAEAPGEEKYRELGVSAFLSKEIGIEVLLKVIEREIGTP